jgi:hypothetical protein
MARGKWLTTGSVAVLALVGGMMIGYQVRLLDSHRARIVPACTKLEDQVICEVYYLMKEHPGPRVVFEVLDSERLLVLATRHDRGRGGILPRRIMIDRQSLEAAGLDYDRMKIYHYVGTSKELKEAKMLRPEDFKYPTLNPQ